MPIKHQAIAQAANEEWQIGVCQTPCKQPVRLVYGCCCPCCASYQDRVELLNITGEPYVCCGGLCPCGPLGNPQNPNYLMFEVFLCPGLASSGNRFLLQTRFARTNTPYDECIICFTHLCSWMIWLAEFVACDVPQEVELLADCVTMSVNGCMHAQQHAEIEFIKKDGYKGPPLALMLALPPHQQHMIRNGKTGGIHAWCSPTPVATCFGNNPQIDVSHCSNSSVHMHPPTQQNIATKSLQNADSQCSAQRVAVAVESPLQRHVRILCGHCHKQVSWPSVGVTIRCPHCGAHNQVPVGPGGMENQQQQQQQQQRQQQQQQQQQPRPSGVPFGVAVTSAAGVGTVGGIVMGDMIL